MMIVGAVVGFITAVNTENPAIGFVTAAIAGALLSTIFATLVLSKVEPSGDGSGPDLGGFRDISLAWETL